MIEEYARCSVCNTDRPEPTTCLDEEGEELNIFWMLISDEGDPVHAGIEEDGSIGFMFKACTEQKVYVDEVEGILMCNKCFDEKFPAPEDLPGYDEFDGYDAHDDYDEDSMP